MLSKYLFSVVVALGYASLGFAQSAITMPWVGYRNEGNYFAGFVGEKAGEHGETTTFDIQPHCPPGIDCPVVSPSITLISAPNTFELITRNTDGATGYSSSACTFEGFPSPSAAQCSEINSWQHAPVPYSTSVNVPDRFGIHSINTVTLTLAESKATASTATTGAAGSPNTVTNTGAAGSPNTVTNTGAAGSPNTVTNTGAAGSPNTGTNTGAAGSPNTATTTGASPTTATGNTAMKPAAPVMVLGGAVAVAILLS